MRKFAILFSIVLMFVGCKKEEEVYTIKTQGDFSGEAYTFGANATPQGDSIAYYAWLTKTPYNGYDCFITILPDYNTYVSEKNEYRDNTEKAEYLMKAKKFYSVQYWAETEGENLSVDRAIVTWYESISKSEYDKLWSHYNEPRMREVTDENGQRVKVMVFDEAEAVNVER